jgi:hypothetical protein
VYDDSQLGDTGRSQALRDPKTVRDGHCAARPPEHEPRIVTRASRCAGPGHFCLALHLSHRCRPDYIFNSSPARLYRLHRSVGVAARVVSTDSPARVASVFPWDWRGSPIQCGCSLARHRARRPVQIDRPALRAGCRQCPSPAARRSAKPSLLPRPHGSTGQVISAWLCTFPIGADRTVTSPAVRCPYCTRGRSHDTGATRSVSTEPCSARFPRYSPGFGGVHRYGAVFTDRSLCQAASARSPTRSTTMNWPKSPNTAIREPTAWVPPNIVVDS